MARNALTRCLPFMSIKRKNTKDNVQQRGSTVLSAGPQRKYSRANGMICSLRPVAVHGGSCVAIYCLSSHPFAMHVALGTFGKSGLNVPYVEEGVRMVSALK